MPIPAEDRVKAEAVAAVALGESVSAVARRLGVSRAAVMKWRDASGVTPVTAVTQDKREDLAGLIVEHTYALLRSLTAIVEHTQDKDWLRKQPAGELAILYGVQFDKLARVAAAFAGDGAGSGQRQLPGPGGTV